MLRVELQYLAKVPLGLIEVARGVVELHPVLDSVVNHSKHFLCLGTLFFTGGLGHHRNLDYVEYKLSLDRQKQVVAPVGGTSR